MNRSRLVPLLAAVFCTLALTGATSASAAPITIGAPLGANYNVGPCPNAGGCTTIQLALEGGPLLSSPVDGVITSWSVKGANSTPGYALRVMSRGSGTFTGISTSAPRTPSSGGVETFATSLAIKSGQFVGLSTPGNGTIGTVSGGEAALFVPSLMDGATGPPSSESETTFAYNAQIQPLPKITALSPAGGPAAGSTAVTITGTDFEKLTSVKFGGTSATSFTLNSEGSITATAPAGTGTVPISVTTIAGTATSAQSYVYAGSGSGGGGGGEKGSGGGEKGSGGTGGGQDEKCTVPKLRGRTLKSAKKRIRASDCAVGKLTKKEGATAKDGEVVKQVPKAGATVPADTKVKLTLAP